MMVTLPTEFVATKFPGYFWNTKMQTLYSLKVDGVLKPLKFRPPNYWNRFSPGYQVSVRGQRRYLTLAYLKELSTNDSQIPVTNT